MKSGSLSGFEPAIEWLRRRGHRIIFTSSTCWYDAFPRVFQAFPYHLLIEPSSEELQQVMRDGRMLGLRYSAPLTATLGKISYHVVYSGQGYGMEQVTRQARQAVRKGLEFAAIEPISLTRLAGEGWILHAETLARQGRSQDENQDHWRKLCLSAAGLPGFEAWGAIHDGKLVASLLLFIANGCGIMLCHQSRTAYLKFGINNALAYVCTQKVLSRPEIKEIFYGLHSLDASWKVDEFKFRMGYTARPVRQRVWLHPAARLALNPAALAAVKYLGRTLPGFHRLAKAAGMIEFYLDGKRPLDEQRWPRCLLKQRDELLLERQRSL